MPRHGFGEWQADASGLPVHPSIVETRERLVDCFAATHGAGFAASKAELGLPATPDAVRATAEALVRIAFSQVGGSFDDPTAKSLALVVDLLSARSLEWGAPADLVVRHQAQIQELLAASQLRAAEGHPVNGSAVPW